MAVLPTGIGPVTGYNIERSLRFNSADSAHLSRSAYSVASAGTQWTLSMWVKRSALGQDDLFTFVATTGAAQQAGIQFDSNNNIRWWQYAPSTFQFQKITTAVFRDVSAWYHLVFYYDTTLATAEDRLQIWVNGVRQTAFSTNTNPSQNLVTYYKTGQLYPYIGAENRNNAYLAGTGLDGYMTEVNFIDGQALTPSSFGETDSNTGVWKPKAYTGTYGTNGFFLKFADNSNTTAATLGKDSSGNGNNWTPNNFSVTAGAGNDSLVDSPTSYGTDTGVGGTVRGNYCTINPLDNSLTLANGNLDASRATASWASTRSTFNGITSGKWYWECSTPSTISGSNYPIVGVAWNKQALSSYCGQDAFGYGCSFFSGQKYNNNVNTNYGSAFATNDVMGIAFDADNGKIWFSKNGTFFASGDPVAGTNAAFTGITGQEYSPTFSLYGTNIIINTNFGQRAFAYTAPSGFKALCTQNLTTPTIGATSTTQANDYMNAVLWTGNASSPRAITGVGFQPDLLWIKSRNNAYDNLLMDAVRGTGNLKWISSNLTAAEGTNFNNANVTSLDSDGFTIGTTGGTNILNASSVTNVAWNWNAGGSNQTISVGQYATSPANVPSIASTVRSNTTSGFSIVTFTTNNTAGATVGHGLGAVPDMIIMKYRGLAANWVVYHKSMNATPQNGYLNLNTTAAYAALIDPWNNTAPSSTVITMGAGAGSAGSTNYGVYTSVAYCFSAVAGYSAFGSYTGNGAADGTFVYTGFRPRYVLIKKTATGTGNGEWYVHDTARDDYNQARLKLYPSSAVAENGVAGETTTTNAIDILSNGFKLRTLNGATNESAIVYIYAAFAEHPFKYSLAR